MLLQIEVVESAQDLATVSRASEFEVAEVTARLWAQALHAVNEPWRRTRVDLMKLQRGLLAQCALEIHCLKQPVVQTHALELLLHDLVIAVVEHCLTKCYQLKTMRPHDAPSKSGRETPSIVFALSQCAAEATSGKRGAPRLAVTEAPKIPRQRPNDLPRLVVDLEMKCHCCHQC